MPQRLFARLRSFFASCTPTRSPARLNLERLEERAVPTVNLFIDFGDGFSSGRLNMTQGQLEESFANGGLQGPNLGYFSNQSFRFNQTSKLIIGKFDYNGDRIRNAADWTDLKADVLELVQRYYAPFNVNVQIVSNSTVAGVQAQMTANDANPLASGIKDAYVFATPVQVGGTAIGPAQGLYGIAGVDPAFGATNAVNTLDNACLVFTDTIVSAAGTARELATRMAYTIAHEAGHSFTLLHLASGAGFPFDTRLQALSGSEVLVGSAPDVPNRLNFDFFTRYPLTRGDGNTNYNNVQNGYDVLANFALSNIGTRADPTLMGVGKPNTGALGATQITGTGAHDIITLTRTGANSASVTVQAFTDSSFTNPIQVPGGLSTIYTYNITLDAPIRVEAGFGSDRIVVDATLDKNITVIGMGGNDELRISGNATATAFYSPAVDSGVGMDGNPNFKGSLAVTMGATTTNFAFEEFESTGKISLQNFASITYQSTGGSDDISLFTTLSGFTAVGGTVDGKSTVPLEFLNVAAVTLDLANLDGATPDDTVHLLTSLTSAGLQNVTINAGEGNNTLDVAASSLALPVAGGGFAYNVGTGNDVLAFSAPVVALPAGSAFTFVGGGGDDLLDLSNGGLSLAGGSTFRFDGGDGSDRIAFSPAGLAMVAGSNFRFDGGLGDDRCDVPTDGAAFPVGSSFVFDGGDGTDTVSGSGSSRRSWILTAADAGMLNGQVGFQGVEGILGDGAPDQFVLQPGVRFNGTLDGVGGQDTVNLTGLPRSAVTILAAGLVDGWDVVVGGLTVKNVNGLTASAAPGDSFLAPTSGQWTLASNGVTYSAPGGRQLTLAGFDFLRGGPGVDLLVMSLAGGMPIPVNGITFDGDGGPDTLRVLGGGGADRFILGGGMLTVNGRTLNVVGIETIDLRGGAGNDSFVTTSAAMAATLVTLRGDQGADRFQLVAGLTTRIQVFGDPATGPKSLGDSMIVNRAGLTLVSPKPARGVTSAQLLFAGRSLISYFGIEQYNSGGSQFLPR